MANTYTLLETITVGAAGAASVTFNSIPQTGYTDLKVVCSVRSTRVNPSDGMNLEFNADTANNYSTRRIYGVGSGTPTSDSLTPYARIFLNDIPGSTATASTFCNSEFYVPNYRSSNQKSVSADTAFENNTTAAGLVLLAGLWTGTAAISSIRLYPDGGNFAQHSTFSLYGVSALGVTPTKAPKATGGSIIQTDGTYWYHAFLSSGTFTPATALSCDVLVVAGGGGGLQGGGGAGGVLGFASQSIGTSGQTVTVGGGGASNTNGSNSSFAALTASVGGARGVGNDTNGVVGGSGSGGGGSSTITTTGGAGTSGQGNAGGGNGGFTGAPYPGGGGGGSGAAGGNATSTAVTGSGGAGVSTVTNWGALSTTLSTLGLGVSGYIAGGGAGGSNGAGSGTGGSGGGASFSAAGAGSNGTAATANTGSGGSGGSGAGGIGGAGGSGLVIVRYLA